MIPWRIMRPSIARDGEQLDPRCSTHWHDWRPTSSPIRTKLLTYLLVPRIQLRLAQYTYNAVSLVESWLDMSKVKWNGSRFSRPWSVEVQRVAGADLATACTETTSIYSVPHVTRLTGVFKPVHCAWYRRLIRLPTPNTWNPNRLVLHCNYYLQVSDPGTGSQSLRTMFLFLLPELLLLLSDFQSTKTFSFRNRS